MSVPHVLIVDDDLALLRALPEALHLRMEEVTVDTCDSARAALDRIAATDYEAIITDIKMPGMDGLALLKEIQALRPRTPTLLITGHGEHDLALQALRGGAYDFIQKPIEREYFVAALTRAIEMRRLSRRIEEQQSALERHAAELERTVEARTHELREANRIKDEFLATVSHEIRTPLNSILGWIQLMRTGTLDAEASTHALHTIERNTKLLAQIINDLLDVSRIITGKLRLRVQSIQLGSVVEAALETIRPATDAKKIRLKVSLDQSAGAVSGDPNRLQQIVWNLLTNAIKFTPSGGNVEVSLERIGSNARITIADDGEGISEEFLPFVFDRFRQADSTTGRMHGGLGLGLAIVRHIVEGHGGTVNADSKGRGKGATFTVSFPLLTSVERRGTELNQFSEPHHTNLKKSRDLSGLRVMIVDDESDARDVIAARTTGEAVDVLARTANGSMPDVLVSDIGMPGEDGIALITRVRALGPEHGGNIPAIALTAYARPEDRSRVLAAGFQRHIAKPVEPSTLAREVAILAGRAAGAP